MQKPFLFPPVRRALTKASWGIGAALLALTLTAAAPPAPIPAAVPVVSPPRYTIADLDDAISVRAPEREIKPWAINSRGWAAVDVIPYDPKKQDDEQTGPNGVDRAVLWKNGTVTELGDFEPQGINDQGDVVGYQATLRGDQFQERAVCWSNGRLTWLRSPNSSDSKAVAINSAGQIVGRVMQDSGPHAWLWDGSASEDLGDNGRNPVSEATDINNQGMVVGNYEDSGWVGFATKACTWAGKKLQGLPSAQEAVAVSDNGLVLEKSFLQHGSDLICFYSYIVDHGKVTPLGWMSGYGINSLGQVAGVGSNGACLWDGHQQVDLSSLLPSHSGWELDTATGINDRGQIIGWGMHNGQETGFLMTPTAS